MLQVKSLVKSFGEIKAVNNISFEVKNGRIFGLLGRNGAGKSTIFRTILNIISPDSGKILYNNKIIDDNISNEIGYLPEEGSLILQYTVLEQCIYYGCLKQMSQSRIKEELLKWLQRFNITQYMNTKLKDLSKGNRQKIQFIIAILHDPSLLILDEPFSGLDPISVEELKSVILEQKALNKMIVFSSHRMDHVEQICDDILILDKGNEIISGDLHEIKKQYSKQNISIVGDFDIHKLKSVSGIEDISIIDKNEYVIKINDEKAINKILNVIKDDKVLKFSLLDISLNDIFIERIGKGYEE